MLVRVTSYHVVTTTVTDTKFLFQELAEAYTWERSLQVQLSWLPKVNDGNAVIYGGCRITHKKDAAGASEGSENNVGSTMEATQWSFGQLSTRYEPPDVLYTR